MSTPLGHLLAGACVGASCDNGAHLRSRLAVGALCGAAADLDFIPGLIMGDPSRFHHAQTHSLLAVVLVGYLAARWSAGRGPRSHWGIFVALAYGTHLLLDFLTFDDSIPRGIPLLWPLSRSTFFIPVFPNVMHSSGQWFAAHNVEVAGIELALFGSLLLVILGHLWSRSSNANRLPAFGTRDAIDRGVASIRRNIGRLARFLITVTLLALIVRLVDLRAVAHLLLAAKPTLLIAAIAVACADRLVMILKWYPLLRVQMPAMSLGRAARAYFVSGLAALVLPASVGGDALRAVSLGRGQSAIVAVSASIVVERLLGLIGVVVAALFGLSLGLRHGLHLVAVLPWAIVSGGLAAVSLIVAAAVTSARVERFVAARRHWRGVAVIERLVIACRAYRSRPRLVLGVAVVSALEQAFPVLVMWLIALSLGSDIRFLHLAVVMPLSAVIDRLPISLNGWGLVEGGLVYLFGRFGISPVQALALALVGRAVGTLATLPGAFFWSDLLSTRRSSEPALRAAVTGSVS